jgi:formylglycine-generating enzyme
MKLRRVNLTMQHLRRMLTGGFAVLLLDFAFVEPQVGKASSRAVHADTVNALSENGHMLDARTPGSNADVSPLFAGVTPAVADGIVADLPAGAAAAKGNGAKETCPPEMVLVEGQYCTEVRQVCTKWLDDESLPFARCGEYAANPECVGERVPLRFCIDRREYTPPGETLPQNHMSLIKSGELCEEQGKRLCKESEWTFACEGEEMRPYPYGFAREPVCNHDRDDLYVKDPHRQVLKDLRVPSGSMTECKSPFGVEDMVGNLDEPTLRETPGAAYPYRTALKGGWWIPARNRCRPATTAHDDHYEAIQIGVRCCDDVVREVGATG